GWIANLIVRGGGSGLVVNLIVGIIGSILGGWLFSLIGLAPVGTLGSLAPAIVGAIVLLWIVSMINRRKVRNV
ncbi:MAG: GlsB/YeaQ/YmgE family stress response membrane protein, partial [Alistipes sp.]|nr:GlsB/YeaQ/YmgE family stress response membrane protein [Alistipes sp.]